MKVLLKVDPASSVICREAGLTIGGLDWVSDASDCEVMIVDRLSSLRRGIKTLFLGDLSEVTAAGNTLEPFEQHLTIGHRKRFQPAIQALYDSHHSGQLGELGLLRLHHWIAGPNPDHSRREALLGHLDLAIWFFGDRPETIYAQSPPPHSVTQIHLGFAKNGMAMLDFAWDLPDGRNYDSLHLIGDRGAAYSDDHRNISLLYSGEDPRALKLEDEVASYATLLSKFIASTITSPPLIPFRETLIASQVADAVRHSSSIRQPLGLVENEYRQRES